MSFPLRLGFAAIALPLLLSGMLHAAQRYKLRAAPRPCSSHRNIMDCHFSMTCPVCQREFQSKGGLSRGGKFVECEFDHWHE